MFANRPTTLKSILYLVCITALMPGIAGTYQNASAQSNLAPAVEEGGKDGATPAAAPKKTELPPSAIPAKNDTPPAKSAAKVTFDENTPGVVIIEVGGERLRIDTTTKTVARLAGPLPDTTTAEAATAAPTVATPDQSAKAVAAQDDEGLDEPGLEPYDYRVVNVPTPKRYAKGSGTLYFTHRFTQPVRAEDSAGGLFGFDSYAVSSFGFTYGLTDNWYISAYRSPLCQTGLCRTIEIGMGYNLMHEKKGGAPLSLSAYASVEGNHNFRKEYTFNLQAQMARSLGKYLTAFFSPAIHLNSNGGRRFNPKPEDYFPPSPLAAQLDLGKHTASFGLGLNARIRPTMSLLFDYTPRVGFKLGRVSPVYDANFNITGFTNESRAALGFGFEKDTARHTFSLTFSNTQGTTTSRYNSSNLVLSPSNFVVGFNISRRLF